MNIISPAYRFGKLTEASYTIKVYVPEAKRIVFGTTGNYQLLLDLKRDDRPAVNLGREYLGLTSRLADDYKFRDNYIDGRSKPKQLVLGVPTKTPTETRWKIEFGKAQTYPGKTVEGERKGGSTTDDYAENALIVGEVLWAHLTRDNNDVCIRLALSEKEENVCKIRVNKGSRKIHKVLVKGVNTLSYHDKLVRINLYDLVNEEKIAIDLKEVWRQQMEALEREMVDEANTCS